MACFIPHPTSPTIQTVPNYTSNPFVSGFEIAIASTTTFTVGAGAARAFLSNEVIQYPSFLPGLPEFITVDITTVGPGGLFPLSLSQLALTADTLFCVYLVDNSGGTTGGSLSQTGGGVVASVVVATGDNFLPPNFDSYRRIGFVGITDEGTLVPMKQSGKANDRLYMFDTPISVLSGGSSTIAAGVDLTTGEGLIPPLDGLDVFFLADISGNGAGSFGKLVATGQTGTMAEVITPVATGHLGVQLQVLTGLNTSGRASVDYLVDNAGTALSLSVTGFVDSLGATLI